MTYRIEGLPRDTYSRLLGLTDAELAARGARRVTADAAFGFPCRVTLEDAEPGDSLILFNHVSHDVSNPYRAAHAVFVNETAAATARYVDRTPPVFEGRTLSLRGFDGDDMLVEAVLAAPGEADAKIRDMFDRPEIAVIHAHNAAAGCFAAKIVRD